MTNLSATRKAKVVVTRLDPSGSLLSPIVAPGKAPSGSLLSPIVAPGKAPLVPIVPYCGPNMKVLPCG